ncbi:ABC transporter permease [Terrisporobacter sp.]
MNVYKAYFKIIKKNLGVLSIYLIIFLAFAISLANFNDTYGNENFQTTKVNVAFINNDHNSRFLYDFRNYIAKNTNLVTIGESKEEKQDALYFNEVEYIITIPKGFTKKILSGNKNVHIEKNIIPNSTSGVFVDNLINKYLNTARRYISTDKNLSQFEIVTNVNKDLKKQSKIKIQSYENLSQDSTCYKYYNFFAYCVFAVLILGVGAVMLSFGKEDLKRRNLSSPMTFGSYNFQIALANITYAVVIWLVISLVSALMYKDYMFSTRGLLLLLNSLVFTIVTLSISLLISTLVKNQNVMSAVANVVALGSCFISGVFVDQDYLAGSVLLIAKFNPTYWYVKANDYIGEIVNFSGDNMNDIFICILIEVLFAIVVYVVNLFIVRQRRVSN